MTYSGQELLDVFEYHVRKSFDEENTDDLSTDLVWYLWTGNILDDLVNVP